jgi:tRNA G18 (ribose-2'-O)-methylase SpoU
VLLLDNVRSAFNVGSLFRTGETAGIQEIVTAGITAHPPHPKLRKTAMQSLEAVPTRHYDNVMDAVRALKEEGYTIVVMETTSKSALYTDTKYPEKTCLVLGNEITGVDTRIIDLADMVVEIPTYGVKNSLNVASAGPIVVFEVLRQWHLRDEQQ